MLSLMADQYRGALISDQCNVRLRDFRPILCLNWGAVNSLSRPNFRVVDTPARLQLCAAGLPALQRRFRLYARGETKCGFFLVAKHSQDLKTNLCAGFFSSSRIILPSSFGK
mmetsp:Transcript_65655/g.109412  ORF Transcript_65655/g.109412 Transcript_65655/m.109412 type:complete len:112 (+) Transcript_65655:1217-1552(+)